MEKRTLKRRFRIFAVAFVLLMAAVIITPMPSQAQTNRYWIGGNYEYGYQMWYIPENWQDDDGNPGMPSPGDNAYVGTSDTPGAQVAYNHWYSSGNLNYLKIDNDSTLFYVGFGRLPVLNTDVGYDSTGTFKLGWGQHDVQGSLVLGVNFGSTGIYEISSGILNVGLGTIVGNWGTGTFTQTGGSVSISGGYGALNLGNQFGSIGTYNLSDTGTLTLVGFEEYIGASGSGYFNQSGGTHTFNGAMYLGVESTGYGQYNMTDGTLQVGLGGGGIVLGEWGGTGEFFHSGGTVIVNDLTLARQENSIGNYELSGSGVLTVKSVIVGGLGTGTFTQSGGTHTVDGSLTLGDQFGSMGTYNLSGTGILSSPNVFVGNLGIGVFNQTGGWNYVGFYADGTPMPEGFLYELIVGRFDGSNGTYNLGGTGELYAARELVGDASGSGLFNQYGSSIHQVTNDLIIGQDPGPGGTYYLKDSAQLSANNILIGDEGGIGVFGQSGTSTNTIANRLVIGTRSETGNSTSLPSSGVYTQTGGTTSVGTDLILGEFADTSGTYNLSGDSSVSLWVGGNELIGWGGTGAFTQTGGTHTVVGDLNLGQGEKTTGTFELSNGDLIINGSLNIGHDGIGIFTQNSGTNSVGYNLVLGNNPTGDGTYELKDGNLLTDWVYIGLNGKGTFTQSGGFHTVANDLNIGSVGGNIGSYTLSGGDLKVNRLEHIGISGTGSFTQDGGTHDITGYLMLGGPGGSGSYVMSKGTLTVGSIEWVGSEGVGNFTQSGGTHKVNGPLELGSAIGSEGIYNLTGDPLLSKLNTNETIVGNYGTGTFNQSGGTHAVTGTLTIAANPGSSGTYKLSGGTLTVVGGIINKGIFNFTGGDVYANMDNYGAFFGKGTFTGNVSNYGTVSPGESPGELKIAGNYIQDDLGKLLIELEGYTQGTEYDFLNITGNATLSGKLDVDLLGTFDPIMGSIFNIIHADGELTGSFTSWDLPTLDGGRIWQIAYNYDSDDVFLKVAPVPEPSTLLLLGSGLLGVVGFMRKRFKKN